VSGPIQVGPPGLLGFLQLKNQGRNPRELVDSFQPTLDLWRHYLDAYAEFDNIAWTFTLTAGGEYHQFSVPTSGGVSLGPDNSEYWWVRGITVNSALLPRATDRIQMQIGVRGALASAGIVMVGDKNADEQQAAVVAPAPTNWMYTCHARGFLVPPASQIGVFVNANLPVTNCQLDARISYTRLPI